MTLTLTGGKDNEAIESLPPEKRERVKRIVAMQGESDADRAQRAAKRAREYADSWKPQR